MTIERPNLADSFTATPRQKVDRAAGLAGLLPPVRPRVPAPADVEPIAAEKVQEQLVATTAAREPAVKKAASDRPVKPTRTASTAAASESADTVVNVGVYLEPDLLDIARNTRRITGQTYDELVVGAFAEISDDQLQATFARAASSDRATGMPARQRRLRGTAGIQIQLRLSGQQRAWLDAKTEAVGAPSRSALVATALRLHLDH